jgi:hypothetical protein
LVWHIFIWRVDGIKKLNGLKSELTMQSPLNWRNNNELEKIGWEKLKFDLYNSQDQLIGLIENKADSYLENEYIAGHSYKHLIEGLIHHDIYHLGQIGITIKLLKSIN